MSDRAKKTRHYICEHTPDLAICPVHGGDNCIARYDHYTVLEAAEARIKALEEVVQVAEDVDLTLYTGTHEAKCLQRLHDALAALKGGAQGVQATAERIGMDAPHNQDAEDITGRRARP